MGVLIMGSTFIIGSLLIMLVIGLYQGYRDQKKTSAES